MKEQVLVFTEEVFNELRFEGFTANVNRFLLNERWLNSLHFVDRAFAETTERLKQVISYDVIEQQGKIFIYERTKKGGEARLHSKCSIGVGGHVSKNTDIAENMLQVINNGRIRELKEEVGLNPEDFVLEPLGCLYSSADAVSRVHFGVAHKVIVRPGVELKFTDDALANGKFIDAVDITIPYADRLETWSKILWQNCI